MSFLAHALIFAMILGAVVLAGAAAAFLVARHYVRRRWHGLRAHVATRGIVGTASLVADWRERVGARATPETLSRGTAARARRRMWVAIEDAEAAVQHADATHAPVAGLPAVCRSLRDAAADLTTLLRLERRLPAAQGRPDSVRAQVAAVITAARDVQSAALEACGEASGPLVQDLIRAAGDEVELVAAALARLRSMSHS